MIKNLSRGRLFMMRCRNLFFLCQSRVVCASFYQAHIAGATNMLIIQIENGAKTCWRRREAAAPTRINVNWNQLHQRSMSERVFIYNALLVWNSISIFFSILSSAECYTDAFSSAQLLNIFSFPSTFAFPRRSFHKIIHLFSRFIDDDFEQLKSLAKSGEFEIGPMTRNLSVA